MPFASWKGIWQKMTIKSDFDALPAVMVVAFAGLIGIALDRWLSNQMIYRIAYLALAMWMSLAAYSLLPTINRSRAGLGLGLCLMSSFSALIFGYWWLFSFLGRPDWYRMAFYWFFVFACTGLAASTILHLWTIGHTRQRSTRYLILALAILALSIAINLIGGPDSALMRNWLQGLTAGAAAVE